MQSAMLKTLTNHDERFVQRAECQLVRELRLESDPQITGMIIDSFDVHFDFLRYSLDKAAVIRDSKLANLIHP